MSFKQPQKNKLLADGTWLSTGDLVSSRAAALPLGTKEENHKRWAAPPLKVLPF